MGIPKKVTNAETRPDNEKKASAKPSTAHTTTRSNAQQATPMQIQPRESVPQQNMLWARRMIKSRKWRNAFKTQPDNEVGRPGTGPAQEVAFDDTAWQRNNEAPGTVPANTVERLQTNTEERHHQETRNKPDPETWKHKEKGTAKHREVLCRVCESGFHIQKCG